MRIKNKDSDKTPNPKQQSARIEFLPYQLVQLKLSCFEGVSEKLKLLNHSYGVVTSKVEIGNGYNVKIFGQSSARQSSYVLKTEDLKVVESLSVSVNFQPKEYIALMDIYCSHNELESAIKKALLGNKLITYLGVNTKNA
ncbi:MAG: hypothetical protein QNJ70_31020 [Xenococcaceae cyanobacterium MO_207.B15]|nr:hypothetical protein [Xenococcaceae cyanobacterium MO_207.B15]